MDSERRLWIYAGLALVAGVGLVSVMSKDKTPSVLPPPGPKPRPIPMPAVSLQKGDRVLLIGDSLAQGLAKPLGQLAVDSGVQLLADGRVSTRIDQWASQPWLTSDLAAGVPKFILVSLGTNDMKLFDPSSERGALDALVTKLRSSRAAVIWILPPTMPFPDQGVLQMIASTGLPLFHSEALSIPRGGDKIHPTAMGFAGWAGAIWAFLRRGIS